MSGLHKRAVVLTYKQATERVRALGITSARLYHARYREDPRLPSAPDNVYAPDWQGWYAFLGTTPPPKVPPRPRRRVMLPLDPAMAAARAAGITSYREYLARYRTIPGLPSNPVQHYPEWPGWPAFFGRTLRSGPFLTFEDFCVTVRALGITSSTEYAQRYRELDSLPSNPNVYYPDFPGWRVVLEKWEQPTRLRPSESLPYDEAMATARAAGFRTSRDYYAGRRQYPGLPLRPDLKYRDRWPGWRAFLGR